MLRDHKPIVFDRFNGLWLRGDSEEVPIDHFTDGENFRFVGSTGFGTRYGIDRHQDVIVPLGNVVRIYNYITTGGSTLIVMTYDGTTGKIYHVVNSTLIYGPIFTKVGMTDFGFVPYNGRAYITPFYTYTVGELVFERGMQNEFLYVYLGDGTAARKAGGSVPAGTITPSLGAAGHTDAGFHLFGVVGETDTGYLSPPTGFAGFNTLAGNSVNFSTVPTFSGSQWTKRHIVATKRIVGYNGNTTGYDYFFIPGATISDNVTTTLTNQSFYDLDLSEDASHLLDNYSEIPAGVALCLYHNRLCLTTTYTDISIILVSQVGEPEAISQIDGLCIVPPDGNPITNAQEMRDVLYAMKRVRTVAFIDNGDVPASWPFTVIDQAIGCPVHGIATVIDSGSSSADTLLVTSYSGIMQFNGKYNDIGLTWKIETYWDDQDKNLFNKIQIVNDPIKAVIYCVLPNYKLLIGDYNNGMDAKKIRWSVWKFNFKVNSVALVNVNDLIIASSGTLL